MKSTIVLPVDPATPDPALIQEAALILRRGGLVAFPTETVYGLGANALDGEAVQGIFVAKGRPAYDPLIVHLADCEALPQVVADVPSVAYTLAARFWPGPLTLVLPRSQHVPLVVTAGGPTVAVRVPAHPVALALIRAAGFPLAAPSANRFGHLSPTQAIHVLDDLDGCIDMVLDGGPAPVGVESTVLSLVMPVPTILRPGGISREALEAALGAVQMAAQPFSIAETLTSPGTLMKHYAPRARLTLYRGSRDAVLPVMREVALYSAERGQRVGLLLAEEDLPAFSGVPATVQTVGTGGALEEVARQLFAALRALDHADVTAILARDFGAAGLGLAIRDRLTRAAAGNVVDVE
ncbi:MAG TPA: L-threonylcarbamoyladenylate synthase [Anaerolineae bacterium]|mgnify:CR=1 FL=1|nr:L-threonylcarbamoyladenylate synthase [Anaerolineae bacterium]HQI86908.1 L-threonylcarbamoyladenylate synthase [Anaerolineae bacterium]